jgi:hypothetical protein
MVKRLRTLEAAQWASSIMVVLVSGLVGQFAAIGMNPMQWAGALLAMAGSIALAVMLRVWPAPAPIPNRRD